MKKQKSVNIFSYILRYDDGAAPNPFGGVCTLTICKPAIRRKAEAGDWVIGTGSKNSKLKDGNIYDLSDSIVYAMKVTKTMTMEEYYRYCRKELKVKIPHWTSDKFVQKVGDCIYDYTKNGAPEIRESVHSEENRDRDLSGLNALLSNHFYYFGEEPRVLPNALKSIIKKNQGHLKIELKETVDLFEKWIKQFRRNKIYADPQLRYEIEKNTHSKIKSICSTRDLIDDISGKEKVLC